MEKGSSVYTRAALGGHVTWVWRVRESVMRLTGGGGGGGLAAKTEGRQELQGWKTRWRMGQKLGGVNHQ